MYLSTFTIIVSGAGVILAHPLNHVVREAASFPAGSSWDILLNRGNSMGIQQVSDQSFSVIDIDLFDTDTQTIANLKTTKKVICYFSAGTREDWRPDVGEFKSGDVGKNMEEWDGEAWLNVKSENVRNVMKKRIKQAADKGCHAIDPDNTDGFGNNQDGFGYEKAVYTDYIRFLAQEAKSNGLAIGLKNSIDIISDVVDVMSFAVNEQCHEYKECARYKQFTDQNKAIFNIEYGGNACDNPSGVKLSTLIKPGDQGLNSLGGACPGQNPGTPETKPSATARPNSSVLPTPTKSSEPSQGPSETATSIDTPTPVSSGAPSQVPTKTSIPSSSAVASQAPSKTRGPAPPTPTKHVDEDEDDEDDEDEDEDEEKSRGRPWRWWRSHSQGN